MKACVLHKVGDIRCEDVETPVPGQGEVLVEVKACGICGSDIPRVYEKGTYHFPTIPGHEFAGKIAELGPGVEELKIGDRGAVIPLIPCQQCASCEIGNYAQCENYNYLGSRTDGGFAEYVAVPEENFLLLPENVSFKEAAMTEPAAVALHALRRQGVDAGDNVVVLGAGPIGILIAQWAYIQGAAKVILIDIVDKKLEVAHILGFEDTFNSKEGDPVNWVTDNTARKGADLVVEAAGVPETFIQSLLMTRKGGKVVIMGNPSAAVDLKPEVISQLLRKEITVAGSWNSRFTRLPVNEWQLVLEMVSQNRLQLLPLITHEAGLEEVNEILEMMRDNREFYNKVMFIYK